MNALRSQMALMMAILFFSVIGNHAVFAQPAANANGTPVHMIVTVEPRKGSEATAVNREDVMVFEGKERAQVTEWVPAQGDHAGLEFFVLIDEGASFAVNTQLEDIRNFISTLPPNAKAGVAYMQNGTAKVEQELTSDHALAAKSLRLPQGYFAAGSSPYFSLSDLVKHWQANGNRREVLMVTSGVDPYYGSGDTQDPYLEAAIEDSQRAGIVVSAIYAPGGGHFGHSYWLNYWGQIYLAKLTEETGGEGYYIGFAGPAPDFSPYLKDAAERLNHQYLLTFLAKPRKKAGMQSVRVTTELHSVDLVAAKDVYVPATQ
jgi:hypothetical protein